MLVDRQADPTRLLPVILETNKGQKIVMQLNKRKAILRFLSLSHPK